MMAISSSNRPNGSMSQRGISVGTESAEAKSKTGSIGPGMQTVCRRGVEGKLHVLSVFGLAPTGFGSQKKSATFGRFPVFCT
jgi:hypothetical protein